MVHLKEFLGEYSDNELFYINQQFNFQLNFFNFIFFEIAEVKVDQVGAQDILKKVNC